MCVKPQVNQSVDTYTDLLLRGNINVKELDYGCGPSSTPVNVEDRCEVNEDDQDCEDDGGDEDGDDESDGDGDVQSDGHVMTHPHPLLAAGVPATPQKSPVVTSND